MPGIYAANGSFNVTVVNGSAVTGFYAADGSINVVQNDGTGNPRGSTHPCGALNVVVAAAPVAAIRHANGSLNVSVSPFHAGTQRVTVIAGSFV